MAAKTGIIPACAGNTFQQAHQQCQNRDHPRMRGEHDPTRVDKVINTGSSPHARGTPVDRQLTTRLTGIIPACAGNTPWSLSAPCETRDHPRMRGEHCHACHLRLLTSGSSPHARGTPDADCEAFCVLGIIPACAGNTWDRMVAWVIYWDHPRMRGEHANKILIILFH